MFQAKRVSFVDHMTNFLVIHSSSSFPLANLIFLLFLFRFSIKLLDNCVLSLYFHLTRYMAFFFSFLQMCKKQKDKQLFSLFLLGKFVSFIPSGIVIGRLWCIILKIAPWSTVSFWLSFVNGNHAAIQFTIIQCVNCVKGRFWVHSNKAKTTRPSSFLILWDVGIVDCSKFFKYLNERFGGGIEGKVADKNLGCGWPS